MSKDIIGLKQADGSFYPILKRGTPSKKRLQVTTSKDNQTTVQINLYCASDNSFADAEFLDTLKIDGLVPHEKKNHQIDLILSLDENDNLSADLNDKESGKTAQKPVNFAPAAKQLPKDISSELVAFNEQNPEKGDFDPLDAVAQTAAAAGVAFSGMPKTDYATGFANDPLFAGETKIENEENPETINDTESSENAEIADNAENPADDLFAGDDLSGLGDLPDFTDDSADGLSTENTETEEVTENADDVFAGENTDATGEGFDGIADNADLAGETEDAEDSASEEDSIENDELPDFSADFDEGNLSEESALPDSSELPDFSDDFTLGDASADLPETDELPDFENTFAAENLEISNPSESEENAETDDFASDTSAFSDFPVIEQSDDFSASESAEIDDNAESPADDLFTGDDLSGLGDLPDFTDDSADGLSAENTEPEETENADSYFDEAAAVAAMASASALGFADGTASETDESTGEGFINDGDDDDFSLDDFSDLDADFELPNEETLAELDKEIDELNMNFSTRSALSEADSFVDTFTEDSTYDDLADTYSNSFAAESGITNFDFLDDKRNRPKLPIVPLVCVLCAVISIASCFVIWLLFLNSKNAAAPVVAETAVTKEYQGVSVLKEDPAKPESAASQLEKALAQENSIIIIDAPIVIPIPVVPVVNQEETKRYQIKRGDTLWDIADSFYKDPWMYEKIAKANRIKNPDYILSGTWIEIPPM